jgi:hypothetical protein
MGTPAQISKQIGDLMSKSNIYQAMHRSVLTVEAASKREAPVRTGNLRRTITSRVEQGGNRGVIGTNASYARPVHEGSRPHIIMPRYKKALYARGWAHPVRVVHHPGNKPNRFMVRAAESSRSAVEREMAGVFNGAMARIH